jgi:hypothetical protein
MVVPDSSHGETMKTMSNMATKKKSSLLSLPVLSEKYLDGAKSKVRPLLRKSIVSLNSQQIHTTRVSHFFSLVLPTVTKSLIKYN